MHFHAAGERQFVPRQLPPPAVHFIRRDAELARLDQLFSEEGGGLVVLTGPGGVGKTAIATRWAHQVRHRYSDGQLYVDLRGFGGGEPLDPGEALGGFLRALGVAPRRVPVSLPEQVALYRTVTADRSLLVLLDNAITGGRSGRCCRRTDRPS